MDTELEYDERVRPSTSASIARCRRVFLPQNFSSFNSVSFSPVGFFGSLIFICTCLVATSFAQNGASGGGHTGGGSGSAGVSFSGSHVAGAVSGYGFSGSHGSGSGSSGSGSNQGTSHSNPAGNANGNHHPRHPHNGGYAGPVWYAVPFPYVEDDSADYDDADADANTNDDSDADYQGGPTIFDRRGTGADSYIPPVEDDLQANSAMRVDADKTPQQPTLLIFKDGHEIEVGNYAIVGVTLFDLTPGHARRVALADLDLEATQKRNDDRGVVFALPASTQAN
jgi:hypothetical protein